MSDRSQAGPEPANSTDFAARKQALRRRLLAARRALPAPVRADAARRLRATLLGPVLAGTPAVTGLGRPGPVTIAAYVPIGSEPGGPDLPAALAAALPPGGRLLLPVLLPDLALDWAAYDPATGTPAGAWRAPPGSRLGPAAISEAGLVVAPALAVDRRGIRLGRGGGSYDRALARVSPHARVVALLYDGELRDEDLPAEPHDQRVSAVITPSDGLVRL